MKIYLYLEINKKASKKKMPCEIFQNHISPLFKSHVSLSDITGRLYIQRIMCPITHPKNMQIKKEKEKYFFKFI